MGCYINPANETKENWLETNGVRVGNPNTVKAGSANSLVCLVNNGPFNAAAVCFNEREFEAFNQPGDIRWKQWYLVERSKLREVSDLHRYEK